MAVVVTDLRTTITEADTLTGWVNAGELSTSVFAEATGSVALGLNIATGQIYFGTTARNLTNTLVYVYTFNNAIQDSWTSADPPNAMHLGDGTNRISFKMAGGDRRVFNHFEGPTEWQCLVLELDSTVLNTMNTDGLVTARAGSLNNLNTGAITQLGADFTTLSKALGGGINVAVDIIRVGNDGLRITGGTTGDRGTFTEIALEDRSTTNQKAHGIIRELGTGVYGCQGPLNFGNVGAAQESWFEDAGKVVSFENRNISNNRYYINVEGNSGTTNSFVLRNTTVSSAGPWVGMTFNSGNINTLELSGMTFSNLGNRDIIFSSLADSAGHQLLSSSFSACGPITAGTINISNCSFSNQSGDYILNVSNGTSTFSDLTFSGGSSGPNSGHAILIETPGEYDFDNFIFNNYGAAETITSAVYNNSGGAVTINVLNGGNSPSIRNGTGATTTVNNPTQFIVNNLIEDSEVRILRQSDLVELAGVESAGPTPTGINGVTVSTDPINVGRYRVTYNYNHSIDIPIFLVIFKESTISVYQSLTLTVKDSSFFAVQQLDRQYIV